MMCGLQLRTARRSIQLPKDLAKSVRVGVEPSAVLCVRFDMKRITTLAALILIVLSTTLYALYSV